MRERHVAVPHLHPRMRLAAQLPHRFDHLRQAAPVPRLVLAEPAAGLATTRAPPRSVMTQESSRCSGSEIIGELTTSSTVTTSRSRACELCWAWCEAATLIQASCALVVPYR